MTLTESILSVPIFTPTASGSLLTLPTSISEMNSPSLWWAEFGSLFLDRFRAPPYNFIDRLWFLFLVIVESAPSLLIIFLQINSPYSAATSEEFTNNYISGISSWMLTLEKKNRKYFWIKLLTNGLKLTISDYIKDWWSRWDCKK